MSFKLSNLMKCGHQSKPYLQNQACENLSDVYMDGHKRKIQRKIPIRKVTITWKIPSRNSRSDFSYNPQLKFLVSITEWLVMPAVHPYRKDSQSQVESWVSTRFINSSKSTLLSTNTDSNLKPIFPRWTEVGIHPSTQGEISVLW